MGICNKLAWPIPSLFIVWLLGKDVSLIQIEDLDKAFYIIIAAFVVLGIMAFMAPLPEVKAAGEDESDDTAAACPYAAGKTSVWQFPHLLLGCLALFLYVGVETVSLGTLVDYANSLGLPGAANYAWIAPIGIVIGYICGIIFIPKYLSQAAALKICSWLAIIGALLVVLTPADISIYFISFMALGCSLMWPALWRLRLRLRDAFRTRHGRPGQVHQGRFVTAHHGHVWRCGHPDPLRLAEGHGRRAAGLLALPPLLPVHPLLRCGRL